MHLLHAARHLVLSSIVILSFEVSLVLCAGAALGCGVDSSSHQDDPWIVRGAAAVERPSPGMRVWSEVLFADGGAETLDVFVDDLDVEHVVHAVVARADEVTPQQAGSGSPTQCNDSAYSLLGFSWDDTLAYRFRSSTTPSELSVTNTEAAIQKATDNIVRGRNSCSLSDQIDATGTYLGRTTRAVQVTASGGCSAGDADNVVAFGDLPGGVLGVTCTWSFDDIAVESDIRLNSGDFWWTTSPTSADCDDAYDVESVMTHERGHSFGLGHVSEEAHAHATMSTAINGPCQKTEVTLGKGDVLGLRAMY